MSDLVYPDAFIRRVLDQTSTIAMVGASANWVRPSNFAMKYLQQKGYRVVPVNPGNAGNEIHGETCYAGLVDVPAPFEMVDIFRRPEDASGIVDEAISLKDDKGIRVSGCRSASSMKMRQPGPKPPALRSSWIAVPRSNLGA